MCVVECAQVFARKHKVNCLAKRRVKEIWSGVCVSCMYVVIVISARLLCKKINLLRKIKIHQIGCHVENIWRTHNREKEDGRKCRKHKRRCSAHMPFFKLHHFKLDLSLWIFARASSSASNPNRFAQSVCSISNRDRNLPAINSNWIIYLTVFSDFPFEWQWPTNYHYWFLSLFFSFFYYYRWLDSEQLVTSQTN